MLRAADSSSERAGLARPGRGHGTPRRSHNQAAHFRGPGGGDETARGHSAEFRVCSSGWLVNWARLQLSHSCAVRGGTPPLHPPIMGGGAAPRTPCGEDGAKSAPPPQAGVKAWWLLWAGSAETALPFAMAGRG